MTFEEIIRHFAVSETVPEDAIRAALHEPAAFVDGAVPLLVRVTASTAGDDEQQALSVLVHVLGEIGDERAFAPLMRLLSLPSEDLDVLLGDTITETLGNILIALAGDRADALEQVLADTRIDEFVRDAVFQAWTGLALNGAIARERAKAFLADYPLRVGLENDDFGWSSWTDSVTALGFAEMTDFARQHLPGESTVTSIMNVPNVTFEDFERQLADTVADPEGSKSDQKYRPFRNTIEELSQWHGYSEAFRRERARYASRETLGRFDEPYVASNPYREVGRNDPCPCGSGKKFKKCCLK